MIEQAKFWDGIATRYAAQPIRDVAAYDYTLGRSQGYLAAEDRVLEIGAGTPDRRRSDWRRL